MSYTFWDYVDNQFQLLDYIYSIEDNMLVMLPHGAADGRIFDRAGNEVTEEFVLKIAQLVCVYMAQDYGVSIESIHITAAPCYPNQVRKKMKNLAILGDWNTPTYAASDSIGWAFVIKSWELTVRNH